MSPALSSTLRCLEIAGWLMGNGSTSSFTVASPLASRAKMARRVGSAKAEKTASRALSVMNNQNVLERGSYIQTRRLRQAVVAPHPSVLAPPALRAADLPPNSCSGFALRASGGGCRGARSYPRTPPVLATRALGRGGPRAKARFIRMRCRREGGSPVSPARPRADWSSGAARISSSSTFSFEIFLALRSKGARGRRKNGS